MLLKAITMNTRMGKENCKIRRGVGGGSIKENK